MNDAKHIGMDVHQATISAAVGDSSGNLVMEATLETKTETILEFVHGLRGSLRVSFEEGTWAAWLHDLLKPHVSEVLVFDSVTTRTATRPMDLFSLPAVPECSKPATLPQRGAVSHLRKSVDRWPSRQRAATPRCLSVPATR
jgi:hypothetical protein